MPADQRLRVLLVDDSAAFRRSAARCLQGQPGCEVVGQASSGDEGLRLAEELRPDLALVDIAMPGIDGLEVARRLKIRTPAPHVVMLTIHDNPGYRAAALEAGADGFICKAEFTLHALSLLRDLAERARLEPPGRKVDPL